jgi:hypothetical protein
MLVGDPSSGYSYKCTVSALATIIETDIADGYVTISTTQTISGAKTFSNNLALTSVANANTDTDKFLVLNASNIVNFRTGAEVLSDIGGQGALTLTTTGTSGAATLVSNVLNIPQYQGVISLASIGSSPNANGATLSSNTLTLQPASGSFGGVVTTGFQEFAGQKRFIGNPIQFDKHLEVKNIDSWGVSWGYTSLASKDTPVFGFLRGHSFVGTVTYYAWFTYGSTGERNYTLPSTDGTLALTSDITSSISGTTNYIPKFTSSSAIGNSNLQTDASGNLGLGVTPSAWGSNRTALQFGALGTLFSDNNVTSEIGANVYISTAPAYTYITSNFATRFTQINGQFQWHQAPSGTAGNAITFTQAMTLDASGRLGIGTTAPSQRLHLASGTTNTAINISHSSNGGVIGYSNTGSTGNLFYVTTGSGVIGSGITMDNSGNVGIGTTAPTSFASNTLQINGATSSSIKVTNTSGGTGNNDGLDILQSVVDTYIWNRSTGFISLGTANTERMRITSGGNVGIGTSSPSGLLQLNGSIATSGDAATFTIKQSSTTYTNGIYLERGGERNGYYMYIGGGLDALTFRRNYFGTQSDVMSLTRDGNVGIGTTSPSTTLHTFGRIRSSNTNTSGAGDAAGVYELGDNSNGFWRGAANSITVAGNYTHIGGYDGIIFTSSNASIGSQSERMRITSAGDVFIGNTAAVNADKLGITYSSELRLGIVLNDTYTGAASGQIAIQFRRNGSAVGDITTTTTSTAYNTSSDYRLKQDLKDFNGLSLVNQINVYDYQWKSDNTRSYGVMAHELQSVLPYAVTGVKDGEKMQGVDYSKIVPILIKSIKELKAEIETLKNK